MYTLESLHQKNLKELRQIGWELNLQPEGDKRLRDNWINAIADATLPLLQLLKDSPAAEVEPVAEAIEPQAQEPLLESPPAALECPSCGAVHALYTANDYLLKPQIRCLYCDYSRFKNYPGAIRPEAEEPIESKFCRIVYPKSAESPIAQNAETRPQLARTESADVHNGRTHPAESVRDSDGAEVKGLGSEKGDRVLAVAGNHQTARGRVLPHQPIELAAALDDERPPNRGDGKSRIEQAAKTSTAHQLLELFKSKAHIVEDSPGVKTEPKLSQSAIASAAKNSPGVELDPNPISTGITLSDSFLSRYSPPQPEIVHFQADDDGQLSLLDFTVETSDEPPDPDDFPTLAEFRQVIALWDAEHPEPLEVSLDSFCEWAPCPDEWYEPAAAESSSTCNFSIPTFDAWCDRANRQTDSDEPPDTGNYARLPGPKPPKFPPRAIGQVSLSQGKSASQNYPETIPKLSHCTAAAGSSQLGRSPPGGDAM